RRFSARPAGVLLVATGSYSLRPLATSLAGVTLYSSINTWAIEVARAVLSAQLSSYILVWIGKLSVCPSISIFISLLVFSTLATLESASLPLGFTTALPDGKRRASCILMYTLPFFMVTVISL